MIKGEKTVECIRQEVGFRYVSIDKNVFKFNGVYEYNGETIGSFENQNDFGLNNLDEFTVYPEDINIGGGVVIV